ncbi:DNA (cytosine-5)-methyltransferase 1B isoform X1 [Ricinus communis]|uniref:DNA (cytosine-5)-methyltransferase 1B isoform X1 n=1 Tax=Ricinus communis TaxID=3988 RepID=UPI00077265E0|nr:DNA (cytosine-5)-methyltransferase 1B isoform X1 [Ricinus communis]|eukprot:XP_015580058.1 DNA (cytosine-5)-methyltransferase 1B isoform X1 [Ricinus communis]
MVSMREVSESKEAPFSDNNKKTGAAEDTSNIQESKPENGDGAASKVKLKRGLSKNVENVYSSRKMTKRAAACSDFKEKPLDFSEEYSFTEIKKEVIVEHEAVALGLTAGRDDLRPNRRLKDFIFHDAYGNIQAVEMLEFFDLFISGLIVPLEESSDKDKEKGIRCNGFGRVESWAISGYEEGSPVIWVSTDMADYDCIKPANRYKKLYNLFFEKAHACVEVYRKLSRMHGGDPNISFDELIAGVVRAMSGSKNFPQGMSIKDFIISQGEFIYNQLIGLDATSKKNDQMLTGLPVLLAMRDEKKKREGLFMHEATTTGRTVNRNLTIDGKLTNQLLSSSLAEEDEDMKLASLRQEVENWLSMKQNKRRFSVPSSHFYIKINEDEIVNDYPWPTYYKTSAEEIDEFLVICDDEIFNPPENVLHNWTLYNSDARLISLELLPMRYCADADMTIFASGIVTKDGDLSGRYLDVNSDLPSSASSDVQDVGLPIYTSAIKEWKIEFGSSMIFISLRTDLSWYRLGKPSKQYAPWYKPVVKTARLAISIITLLQEQRRVSRLSFADVIQRVSKFNEGHHAFISSLAAEVERYVVVHGQIILQLFSEFPVKAIQNCPFVTDLHSKMQQINHLKLRVKEKRVLKKGLNLNPREAVATISERKAMAATTTKLINRIWGDYYSNYSPEESNGADGLEIKEDDEVVEEQEESEEEDSEEIEEQKMEIEKKSEKTRSTEKLNTWQCSNQEIRWVGGLLGKSCTGKAFYKKAFVHGGIVAVGDFVMLGTTDADQLSPIYFVEYMFENSDMRKMAHGKLMLYGSQTVLGNTANKRELFLANDCLEFELSDVKQNVVVEFKLTPWGYRHRKASIIKDRTDRERTEERRCKGLPMEYFCKSQYLPERGAFICLSKDTMGLGNGVCHSCKTKEIQMGKESFRLNLSSDSFVYKGTEYCIHDYVYRAPHHFTVDVMDLQTFKGGRNVRLRPYVVCQLLEIQVGKGLLQVTPESILVKVRRFFRSEDISAENAYCSDIREVYYSEHIETFPILDIQGKCEVRKKHDLPSFDKLAIFEHIFFCEHIYDPEKGTIKQLPAHIKLSSSKERMNDDILYRKKKGKCKEGENDFDDNVKRSEALSRNQLATLDIFAGCGGLSEGLERAGISVTKWAIEYEEPAGEAFKQNHPEALMLINNCNVILRAIMSACGDADDCICTSEASELAEKLDEKEISNFPRPGEVEFINGGPPCQGFSGMNRFNQRSWSKVQCEMILAFLSFADYFRPKFFLLENVRNFVSFNKGNTFRLTLASLLEMGYQVRFGVLEAGAFGISQSRKRAFIWAASPEEILPEWPEPMHVFAGPELKIKLSGNSQYAAVRSTANGAPFRAITVRDTIGDLPAVGNGASLTTMQYKNEPVSWFQKTIRGDALVLTDHISKEMNELNLIRCKRIPKHPGADWRDLPDKKVKLSNGQLVDLVPWCLPNTAKRHNQWKGLFGRLDWEGNFPTSVTDPQPMGKVGMCFHPEQDRILTVRECARSQGFADSYQFLGNIQQKHRQIGNAVPPPLAFALGRKLKEAVEMKRLMQ